MSLPCVKEEVIDAVMAQYNHDDYNQDLWNWMVAENPFVFMYIHKMSGIFERDFGVRAGKAVSNCTGILYRMP